MKKIINNKKYDTETAKLIGSYDNGGTWNDFTHLEERLYQKRTGEFFIHGEGGPMTKYAASEGQNSWTGGEKIIPVSYAKAREWAEEYLDADEYEAAFGAVTEGDDDTIVVKLPAAIGAKIRTYAAQKDLSIRDAIIKMAENM